LLQFDDFAGRLKAVVDRIDHLDRLWRQESPRLGRQEHRIDDG
jgi:hypothetical protein